MPKHAWNKETTERGKALYDEIKEHKLLGKGASHQHLVQAVEICIDNDLSPYAGHLIVLQGKVYPTVAAVTHRANLMGVIDGIQVRPASAEVRKQLGVMPPPSEVSVFEAVLWKKGSSKESNEYGIAGSDENNPICRSGIRNRVAMAATRAKGRVLKSAVGLTGTLAEEITEANMKIDPETGDVVAFTSQQDEPKDHNAATPVYYGEMAPRDAAAKLWGLLDGPDVNKSLVQKAVYGNLDTWEDHAGITLGIMKLVAMTNDDIKTKIIDKLSDLATPKVTDANPGEANLAEAYMRTITEHDDWPAVEAIVERMNQCETANMLAQLVGAALVYRESREMSRFKAMGGLSSAHLYYLADQYNNMMSERFKVETRLNHKDIELNEAKS